MRNKTMRRGLAWILSAATIMTSVPVSAEEIVLDTNVVSEDEAAAEEQNVDADLEEEVVEDDEDIESQAADDEEEAVVIDGTDGDTESSPQETEDGQAPAVADMEDPYSYVYTGQEITPVLAEGETVVDGTASAVNVGEYTVELTDAEGVTREQVWNITPAELTATCYYAEVKSDVEENTDAETESSEENANIEVAVEVTGFVEGEDETTVAGYVAPQYTQPATLEDAAIMKAFGGEADNYTFVYANSVNVGEAAVEQIATLSDDDIWKSYMWSSKAGMPIVMLEVASFNEEIAAKLTDDCTLAVEEITEGDSYDRVKALLNAEHDNSVEKFGYIKLTLKDKDGNVIDLEDGDTILKVTYIGGMEGVSNVPTYVYGVNSTGLMPGAFTEDGEPTYGEGMMSFISMMTGTNEVAVVAADDLTKPCPLNPGTYTITANLTVLGADNDVLEGMQVFLGNPNFPPLTPLSYNAKLVVDENKKMTLTLENFSEIFQIVSMEDGTDVHIKERYYTKSETDSAKKLVSTINGGVITPKFRHDDRINGLVLTLDNANGLYEFGNCAQCPIILDEDHYMKMHLQVNFDEYEIGYDDTKGDTAEKTFTDDATGVTVAVRTTEQEYADRLEGAALKVKENKSGNYCQMIQDLYYDGTVQKKIYDISLKDKDGKEIDLSNTDNTETKLTIKTDYEENRLWKIDGLETKKLRATSEKNLVTYTNLKTGLGTFAVVDNTSATQYANARTKSGNAVGIYFKRQLTSGFGNITEDTNLENGFGKVQISEKEISTDTAYQVAVVDPSTGEKVDSIGGGETKLGLYVPYSSAKEYYLVYTNGDEQTVQKLDASNHNDEYVLLTVMPETSASNANIINTGLYNAVTGNTSSWQCYVLATDRKLASTPSTVKEWSGKKKELIYSGKAQNCFTDGEHYQLISGNFENTNAGIYSITVVPEDGYLWADGTNSAKTISAEIQKHNLAVRYKSEVVLVNGTPKYEIEYGYTTSDITFTGAADTFVEGETPDNISGYVAPTVTAHATDVAGDYVLTPTGGESDNYKFQMVSGTLHVVDSQEKIVTVPKMYEDTTYPCIKTQVYALGGSKTYIVPKYAKDIAEVIAFETPEEDAKYTLTGALSSNKLGTNSVQVKLKDGYVWEDGTTRTKTYSYMIYQVIDKPVGKEKVEYNGKEQYLFDDDVIEAIESKSGRYSITTYLGGTVKNDQYKATEVGEYKFLISPGNAYCWDETGDKSQLTYNWSIVAKEDGREVASTEVITANLGLKGSDAFAAGLTILQTLVGADGSAYLTNPNAPTADSNEDNDPNWVQTPPTASVSDNATLITYTDGTMALKVPVKNAVFTLQKLGTSDQVAADDVILTTRNGKYGANTSRIDSITIPVTAKTGSVTFKDSEVYPTLLMTGYTVPLTLTWGTKVAQEKTSISNATVTGIADATYTGKAITQPNLKVTLGGGLVTLTEGADYTVTYANNVNAGTATITITGIGNYKDSITRTFTIKAAQNNNGSQNNGSQNNGTPQKGSQTINVKVGSKTYKYKNIQKKAANFTIGASAAGTVSYKVTATPKKGSKYISVNSKGKVTLKKKAPAGTYQITVFATATADKNAASRIVTVNVSKEKQKLTAKVSRKTVKAKALKKKAVKITVKAKAKGKLTYKVTAAPAGADKYISVTKKGKVTLKKGAQKGTYKIQVTAGETSRYAKAVKTVSIKVK